MKKSVSLFLLLLLSVLFISCSINKDKSNHPLAPNVQNTVAPSGDSIRKKILHL